MAEEEVAEFDPYYEWLGVPPEEQPPNHYRLLGVPQFEPKDDVIANAADRQMAYVRTFQNGPHHRESQKVLNELSAARRCLLDPERRKAYDHSLRFLAGTPDPLLAPAQARLLPLPEVLRPDQAAPKPTEPTDHESTGELKSSLPALLIVAGVTIVLLVAVLIVYANYMGDATPHKPVAEAPPINTNPNTNVVNPPDPTPPVVTPDPVPKIIANAGRPPSSYPLLTVDELQRMRAVDSTKVEIRERALDSNILETLTQSIETTRLRFEKTDLNDSDLAILAKLKNLQRLAIIDARITNNGLPQLQGLKRMKSLEVSKVNATAQAVAELAVAFPELRELSIDALEIEPKAIDLLVEKCPLSQFSASGTKLSDAELEKLCKLSSLTSLRLSATAITSTGLIHLQMLPKLESLDVSDNKGINSVAVGFMARCPSLRILSLARTAVDGLGSSSLMELKQLTELDLTGCNFSPETFRKLRSNLPNCKIKPLPPGQVASTGNGDTNTTTPEPAEPIEMLPAPSADEQKAADARVRAAYGEEIDAAKTSSAKIAMAAKLSEQAPANKENPPAMFVLLRLSAQLSAEGGDLMRSFEAADAMGRQFEVDLVKIKAFLFGKAMDAVKDNAGRQTMVSLGFDLADAAISAERYETAAQIAKSITTLNSKLKEGDVTRQLRLLNERLQEVTKLWEAAQSAEKTLAANDADAEAHLTLAKYLALGRGQWETAREHFARGSDDRLKAIAAQEEQAEDDPELMVAVADAWWSIGESAKGTEKDSWQERAGQWYEKALPNLTGLDHTKAQKRIAALGGDAPESDGAKLRTGPGMIGRAMVDGVDAGIVFVYHPGKCIRTADLEKALGMSLASHNVQISLTGSIELRDDAQISVWHVSGGGNSQITIDNRGVSLLNEVALQRNITPGTGLRKGQHQLTWTLLGSNFGTCSLVLPFDRTTGKPLPVSVTRQLLAEKTAKKGSKKVDLASSEGLPKSPTGLKTDR